MPEERIEPVLPEGMTWTGTDENDEACPGTLGEYLDLCLALAPNSKAVQALEEKIAEKGRDTLSAPDAHMRAMLMPLMILPADPKPPKD